jgi:hypothetical protein
VVAVPSVGKKPIMIMGRLTLVALLASLSLLESHSFRPRVALFRRKGQSGNEESLSTTDRVTFETTANDEIYSSQTKEEESSIQKEETKRLTFSAKTSLTSKPLKNTSPEKLLEFFKKAEHRDLIVTGGSNKPAEEVELTAELLQQWREACDVVGSKYPCEDDIVVITKAEGFRFLGLHIVTVSMTGVKLLVEKETSIATYEFTNIRDEQIVTGLPLAVLTFNILTGAGHAERRTKTCFVSRLSYDNSVNQDEIVLKDEVALSVAITFPSFLSNILPKNLQKVEQKGSASIQKVLDKEVKKGLVAFEEAYEKWVG